MVQPGRAKRWLIRGAVGLAVLAAGLLMARAWLVPALIARAVGAKLGSQATFQDWWFDGRSAGVVGLVVREAGAADAPVWLSAERVSTDLSFGRVLRSGFSPGRVTIQAPEVLLRFDRRGALVSRIGAKQSAG